MQTRTFLRLLEAVPGGDAGEEVIIATTGDAVQDRPLADIGGKGLFAKEIHEALLDGRIDCAVHSLKDLETELPAGIVLGCVLKREDARDVLILGDTCGPADPSDPLAALPPSAVVGTSSVRRQAQLLHARPDLRVVSLRGNVQTRLAQAAGRRMPGEHAGSGRSSASGDGTSRRRGSGPGKHGALGRPGDRRHNYPWG